MWVIADKLLILADNMHRISDDMQIVQIDFFYGQLGHLLQTAVRDPLVEPDDIAGKVPLQKVVFSF